MACYQDTICLEFCPFTASNGENIEKIDEAIIWLGIVEIRANELDHPIVIDECIRLAKKFSNPNSYKFVNAKLDEWLKKAK